MAEETLAPRIAGALKAGEPFGPVDTDGQKMEVQAEAVREAVLGFVPDAADSAVIWLRNLRIVGELDLRGCRVQPLLAFEGCHLESVNLMQAEIFDLSILGCKVDDRICADQLVLRWNLRAVGLTARSLSLAKARVGGQMTVEEAVLGEEGSDEEAATALQANGLQLDGDLMVGPGCRFFGTFDLTGGDLGGNFTIEDTTLAVDEGHGTGASSLNADRLRVAGHCVWRDLQAAGSIRLVDARLGGELTLQGARLEGGKKGENGSAAAFDADSVAVTAGLHFKDPVEVSGEVRLPGATIGGDLTFHGVKLRGDVPGGTGVALNGDAASVAGGVYLGKSVEAVGELRLVGAKIGGDLNLRGVSLTCLDADPDSAVALNADSIEVADDLLWGARSSAVGEVRLSRAKIQSQLGLLRGCIRKGENSQLAVNLVGAEVDELLFGLDVLEGGVDLSNARVRSLWDAIENDFIGRWPNDLVLEGFEYWSLREPLNAEKRLEWIAPSQADGYRPGVYVELARVLRRLGQGNDARQVEIASERRAIEEMKGERIRWLWNKLLWVTTGSGYRNWLAGLWLLGVLGLGALLFWLEQDTFVPILLKPPAFNPVLYAIDVTVPVLDVGQQRAWAATGSMRWVSLVLTVTGYALVTAVIAAAAGLLNRDQRD